MSEKPASIMFAGYSPLERVIDTPSADRLNQGNGMLSPHEFATLMLIKDAPDRVELGRAELDTLLERQLISLEDLASGRPRVHVTSDGDSILEAVSRMR
jgi:hypothetical protein